ncbi:MAG: hypothetical protein GVY20_09255 [Bacteroidetes bacterium]|jgi:hypothetical protein|nr:hypothetical protein [Bacteroidota bacterium]
MDQLSKNKVNKVVPILGVMLIIVAISFLLLSYPESSNVADLKNNDKGLILPDIQFIKHSVDKLADIFRLV